MTSIPNEVESFVAALSRPGARLLVHPDDLALINSREAGSIPGLPAALMDGIEVITCDWAERGRLVVPPPPLGMVRR